MPKRKRPLSHGSSAREQHRLPLAPPQRPVSSQLLVYSRIAPAQPTIVFDTYWRFATERQDIFFRRLNRLPPPWTADSLLQRFKFTNAYRASDRVSQFLIKRVLYEGSQEPRDVFLRTLLFKVFNRIETWKLLNDQLGQLSWRTFDVDRIDRVLTAAMGAGQKIYSAAYLMPSGGRNGPSRKHRSHLLLIKAMLDDNAPERLTDCPSMQKAFEILRSYPMIGDFLAYQYVTDLNYSSLLAFSEREFVVPGPGARDGIRKCFSTLGGLNESDVIRLVADTQEEQLRNRGLLFKSLWGRALQLIDCQNLFCEVDKYARYAHPEYVGLSGRRRIKQKFRASYDGMEYWYPPKWGLNKKIHGAVQEDDGDLKS